MTDRSVLESVSVCPSCSKETTGRYCSHCGEKVVGRDDLSVAHFVREAFHEVTDVDSKFLRTLKLLLTRPGFLTLEALRGRRNLYIKPFRLYLTLVVLHFLLFATFPSGDIFHVERFPPMQFAPAAREVIAQAALVSAKPHAEFITTVSNLVRKNLEIFTYLAVFMAAAVLYLMYASFNRYYVEHLYFVLHVFSFGLVRNILIIPLIVFDLIPLALFIVLATQFGYAFLAMKKVYQEKPAWTVLKFTCMVVSIGTMYYGALHICVFAALQQL